MLCGYQGLVLEGIETRSGTGTYLIAIKGALMDKSVPTVSYRKTLSLSKRESTTTSTTNTHHNPSHHQSEVFVSATSDRLVHQEGTTMVNGNSEL